MSLDYIDEYWFNPFKKNKEAKMTQEQDEKEGKMDEIKEAEEISTGIVEEYLELLKPFVQQIERLNIYIKELEEKIELAEATREDALAYAKGYKSELDKWTTPHDDSDLQEMKEQSQQLSWGAKQAYIDALEWTVKHREIRVKELEDIIEEIKENHRLYG